MSGVELGVDPLPYALTGVSTSISQAPQWPGGMGGIVIPPLPIRQRDIHPGMPPASIPPWLKDSMSSITPPPRATGGTTAFGASITSSPKSVAEVVYDVTPFAGIAGLVRELRDTRPRPALPQGVTARIPARVRDGFTRLQRGSVRRLPIKRNVSIPVDRE